jgi:signal transduction histidine kinase
MRIRAGDDLAVVTAWTCLLAWEEAIVILCPYAASVSPRRWWQLPWVRDDVVVVVTYIATAMFVWDGQIAVTEPAQRAPGWFVLVAVTVAPLIVRRTRPVLAFAASTLALSALALVDSPIGFPLASGVALHALASSQAPTVGHVRTGLLAAGGFVVYVTSSAISIGAAPWSELFHTALLWSACWLAGERARLQREQIEELRRDALRERALATAEERMRIARDLHDAVGHTINVIAVHAGGARLRHCEDPDRSLVALMTIEDLARQTVAEIDEMVAGLRSVEEASDVAPASLESLPSLVRGHVDAGHQVRVDVRGVPRRLPAAVDQAAYRIAQESLTNATRHGCGPVDLQLDYGAHAIAVIITNPTHDNGREPRRGHGLTGAMERAHLVGGRLDTTVDAGRFVVTAVLPTDAGRGG